MKHLTFTTLLASSADEKLMTLFLLFPRKQDLIFHANCLIGDNLHELLNPVFYEKIRKLFLCRLLKILPRVLSVKQLLPRNCKADV